MIKRILLLSLSAAAAVILCSCGKPDIKASGRPTSQLRGEEAPVRHVDSVLARNSSLTGDQTEQIASAERITDQELLATEALQARLDRDERVARAIERARRQILAQAYIDRAMIAASQPTAKEIGKFYEDNPALFAERRIYRVRELSVDIAPERFGSLRTMVAGAKNLAEVERWLDSRKLSFDAAASSWAAEQIPLSILRRLFQMREGQIEVFPAPNGASVVRLEQSAEAAIGRKQAEPVIARYLLNRKRLELAHTEVIKLRERAHSAKDGVEPIRAPTAVKTAAQLKPLAPGPAMAHTGEIAKLR